jgi:MFS family permease
VAIAAAVHVSVGRTAVLVPALYLASAIAQPTCGKLAEEFGPRRVFIGGICLLGAGGAVGWAARDLTTLVVARALIGVGTSAGYPSAMLLIRRRAEQAGLDEPPGSVPGTAAARAGSARRRTGWFPSPPAAPGRTWRRRSSPASDAPGRRSQQAGCRRYRRSEG